MQLQVWHCRRLLPLLPAHSHNAIDLEFVSVCKSMFCGSVTQLTCFMVHGSVQLCCLPSLCLHVWFNDLLAKFAV